MGRINYKFEKDYFPEIMEERKSKKRHESNIRRLRKEKTKEEKRRKNE